MTGKLKLSGFALVDLSSPFAGKNETAFIRALVMKKHAEKDFVPFLNDLESFLFQQGFSKITIAANAANANAINLLLKEAYKLDYALARMIWKGNYNLKGIDLSKWAM